MGSKALIIALLTLGFVAPAMAQTPNPLGGPPNEVINQGRKALLITPTDNLALSLGPTRAVFVGTAAACALAVILADDTAAVTFSNIQAGAFLPIRVKVVMSTNTTCAGIVGLW